MLFSRALLRNHTRVEATVNHPLPALEAAGPERVEGGVLRVEARELAVDEAPGVLLEQLLVLLDDGLGLGELLVDAQLRALRPGSRERLRRVRLSRSASRRWGSIFGRAIIPRSVFGR